MSCTIALTNTPEEERYFDYLLEKAKAHAPHHVRTMVYFKRAMERALQPSDPRIAEGRAHKLLDATLLHYQNVPSVELATFWKILGENCRIRDIQSVAAPCFEQVAIFCSSFDCLPPIAYRVVHFYAEAGQAYEKMGKAHYAKAVGAYSEAFRYAAFEGISPEKEVNHWDIVAYLCVNAAPPQYAKGADCFKKAGKLCLKKGFAEDARNYFILAANHLIKATGFANSEVEKFTLASQLKKLAAKCIHLRASLDGAKYFEAAANICRGLSSSTVDPVYTKELFELAAELYRKLTHWLQAIACYEECLEIAPQAAAYPSYIKDCWISAIRPFLDLASKDQEPLLLEQICALPKERRNPLFILLGVLGPTRKQDNDIVQAIIDLVSIYKVSTKESESIRSFLRMQPDVCDHASIELLIESMLILRNAERRRMFALCQRILFSRRDKSQCNSISKFVGLWRDVANFPAAHQSLLISFLEKLNDDQDNTVFAMRGLVAEISKKVAAEIPLEPIFAQMKEGDLFTIAELKEILS